MKLLSHAVLRPLAIGVFRIVDRLRSAPHRYILILSHMRSGSSLLLHLLMTSPVISGSGERNTTYRDEDDLAIFAIKSNLAHRERFWASYSVDQVNHSHFLPTEDLMLHPSVLPIILFREPQGAIGSMVDVLSRFHNFGIDDAIEHYRERVTTLARYATILKTHGRMMALTYDDLIADTEHSLLGLKDNLGLPTPLSATYSTFPFTGRQGDPSSRIQAGRVLPRRTDHAIEIDSAILNEMIAIFEQCMIVCR